MAWNRKILRVDLTNGSCKSEPLNMQWAQEYLGQRGLATKYFVDALMMEDVLRRADGGAASAFYG